MTNAVIFIVGPTGVGKSAAGLGLAHRIGGEIVSCDAMQVYREVNIACDKPSPAERAMVPHHVVDAVSVTEEFDVARYRQLAGAAIEDILRRGRTPVVVGGSGMYMAVLLDGIFDDAGKDPALRKELLAQAEQPGGLAALAARLRQVDPLAAGRIHPHDLQRTVRALEVALTKGQPISLLQPRRDGLADKYPVRVYGLKRPRAVMYARAEARIDRMFEQGLAGEVTALLDLPLSRTAATVIGIPEVGGYLRGEYDVERAKYLMKRNTRHYIKRQMTWFRRDPRLRWIEIEDGDTPEDVGKRILVDMRER